MKILLINFFEYLVLTLFSSLKATILCKKMFLQLHRSTGHNSKTNKCMRGFLERFDHMM